MGTPWFWKIPPRQWPAFWLHYPPEWLWRALRLVPRRLRWALGSALIDLPGVCGVSVHSIGEADYPESGVLAAGCMRDGAPCWCGKYLHASEWVRDMEKMPDDPMRSVQITFKEQV